MLLLLLRLCVTIFIAFLCGRLIAKLKLPSILGWLICAMILGPHAVSLINQELLDAAWYQNTIHVMECAVGLMIGTELVWKKIKRSGIVHCPGIQNRRPCYQNPDSHGRPG